MAGDNQSQGIGRREFHLSTEYPYVFRMASYLNTQGPEPMRYGEPAIDCTHRSAPALPQAAKGKEPEPAKSAEKSAAPSPSPSPSPSPAPTASPDADKESASSAAAYPVGANAPTPPAKGNADFSKSPDEVTGYFRDPYNFVPNSHRFFDPIFDPAQAPQGQTQPAQIPQGPKSTATSNVTH